jgi:uncharacterized protein
MAATDLIVQCVSMSTIQTHEVRGLRSAVEAGTGLAGWHGGILASYHDSTDYLHLVGGQFAAHPGNFVQHTIRINPDAREHPIVAGLADFDLLTEQYWVLTDQYMDVLAKTTQQVHPGDPWHRPVTSPAVWTRLWGKGHVFVATPGHSLDILQHPSVAVIIQRGMLWASR